MNPKRTLILFLCFSSLVSCQEYVQQKCSSACKFFVQCAVTEFKDSKITEVEKIKRRSIVKAVVSENKVSFFPVSNPKPHAKVLILA